MARSVPTHACKALHGDILKVDGFNPISQIGSHAQIFETNTCIYTQILISKIIYIIYIYYVYIYIYERIPFTHIS